MCRTLTTLIKVLLLLCASGWKLASTTGTEYHLHNERNSSCSLGKEIYVDEQTRLNLYFWPKAVIYSHKARKVEMGPFSISSSKTNGTVIIRPLLEADLEAADRVMRLAFGIFLKLPDPLQFMGDADYVHTRWRADPSAAFCAVAGDLIVGSVFAGNWGSVAFFGPLTVHPDYWDHGVAQLLLRQVMECFERWGTRHMGLYTFSTSLKHIGLYRKFGFSPRFLTISMEKEVSLEGAAGEAPWTKFSDVPAQDREGMLDRCRALTGKVFGGLDVGVESVRG